MTVDGAAAGRGRAPRMRWVAAGALGIAAVSAAAVAVSSGGSTDSTADAAATQSTATTKIVRQDLVEQETVDGTLGYSDARAVVNRLPGTVTWTPRVGSVVRTNHALYAVNGKAVYLLNGIYPAYRSLQSGLTGGDVLALERNLRHLGLDHGHDMTVDGDWDAGTTAAVKRWQRRKGLSATGSIEKGLIVFQPGARRIGTVDLGVGQSAAGSGGGATGAASSGPAAYRSGAGTVETVDAVARSKDDVVVQSAVLRTGPSDGLGGDGEAPTVRVAQAVRAQAPDDTSSAGSTPAATTPATTPVPSTSPPSDHAGGGTTPSATTPAARKPGGSAGAGAAPKSSATAAPGGTGAAGGGGAPSGGAAGASPTSASATAGSTSAATADVSSTLMTTTSTKRIVSVDLEATKQAMAQRGARATVEFPDGSDAAGTIATVGKVAQKKATSSNTDPPSTIKLVVKLTKSVGSGLDQAPVDVHLTKSRAQSVLTVPVTALIAQQGGTFAVEVRSGASRRVIPVTTGLYTDSDVEIRGQGLTAGMTVTNARI